MPTGNANLVSVIIPSYNRASMLVEALESISAQTYRPLEIVVVDDGSTDDTSSVVKRWYAQTAGKGEGLSLLYLYQSNSGPSAARNNGAGHAHGEFLTFHDSDDLMDPERIALQIAEMQRMGSDLCENTVSAILLSGVIHTAQMGDDRLLSLIRDSARGFGLCWIIRRDLFDLAGGWDPTMWWFEDVDLVFRLLLHAKKVAYCPAAVCWTRRGSPLSLWQRRDSKGAWEGMLRAHQRWVGALLDRRLPACCEAEGKALLDNAVLSRALGYVDMSKEFCRLAVKIAPACCWGRTSFQRALFRIGSVRLCGDLIRSKRAVMHVLRRIGRRTQ